MGIDTEKALEDLFHFQHEILRESYISCGREQLLIIKFTLFCFCFGGGRDEQKIAEDSKRNI